MGEQSVALGIPFTFVHTTKTLYFGIHKATDVECVKIEINNDYDEKSITWAMSGFTKAA